MAYAQFVIPSCDGAAMATDFVAQSKMPTSKKNSPEEISSHSKDAEKKAKAKKQSKTKKPKRTGDATNASKGKNKEEKGNPSTNTSGAELVENLKSLGSLFSQGILSEDEFAQAKKRLLEAHNPSPAPAASTPAKKESKIGNDPEEKKTAEEWRLFHADQKRAKTPAKKKKASAIEYDDLVVGQEYQGKVKLVNVHGAFIDIKCPSDGFCHVSRLKDTFVKNTKDVIKKGDIVTARVLSVQPKKGCSKKKLITLSLQSKDMFETEMLSVAKYEAKLHKMKSKEEKTDSHVLPAQMSKPESSQAKLAKQARRNERRLAKQGKTLTVSTVSQSSQSSQPSQSSVSTPIVIPSSAGGSRGKGGYPSNSKRLRDGSSFQEKRKPRLPPTIIQPKVVFGAAKRMKFG